MDRYKIYADLNFAVTRLESGNRSFEDVIALAQSIIDDVNFSKIKYHVIDLRGCKMDFHSKKVVEVFNLVKKHQSFDNQLAAIYLIDDPISTAYVQMYTIAMKNGRDYCVTPEKAYDKLGVDFTFDEFSEMLAI